MPATGGAAAPVLNDDHSNVNLPGTSWNARTNRITFSSDRAGGNEEIYTSKPDGTDIFQVTSHMGNNFFESSFSPDGSEIAFESNAGPGSAEIWKVKSDGDGRSRLTSASTDRQPNWSPDGSRILFQRLATDWAIYTIKPDGNGLAPITPSQDSSTDASFSPDGKRIVYSTNGGRRSGANLFVVPADGGMPRRVTDQPGYDGAPTWSPDGRWIAFESSPEPGGMASTSIWRIAAP